MKNYLNIWFKNWMRRLLFQQETAREKAYQHLIRQVVRAWKPHLTKEEMNKVLHRLSEDAKDVLYPNIDPYGDDVCQVCGRYKKVHPVVTHLVDGGFCIWAANNDGVKTNAS